MEFATLMIQQPKIHGPFVAFELYNEWSKHLAQNMI